MGELMNYDIAFGLTTKNLERALDSSPMAIRQFTEHLSKSRGKMLRAKSLLTCAMDGEGKIHPDATKLAASVEILHLATLVHDDVMDDADLRRGVPTLQKEFGKKTAVICGDYLLCQALSTAASLENRERFLERDYTDYIRRICLGELRQHLNNYNFSLTWRKYLGIIAGKTAALFEASFYGGVLLATEDERIIKEYIKLGRYIGMIFQLLDDCADYEEDEEAEKKPVQSDFEQGVVTLPLIYVLEDEALKEKVQSGNVEQEEINQIVKQRGGISFTKSIARKYYDKVYEILDGLNMTDEKRSRLTAIVDQSYRFAKGNGQKP